MHIQIIVKVFNIISISILAPTVLVFHYFSSLAFAFTSSIILSKPFDL